MHANGNRTGGIDGHHFADHATERIVSRWVLEQRLLRALPDRPDAIALGRFLPPADHVAVTGDSVRTRGALAEIRAARAIRTLAVLALLRQQLHATLRRPLESVRVHAIDEREADRNRAVARKVEHVRVKVAATLELLVGDRLPSALLRPQRRAFLKRRTIGRIYGHADRAADHPAVARDRADEARSADRCRSVRLVPNEVRRLERAVH